MASENWTSEQMLDWVESTREIEMFIGRKSFLDLFRTGDAQWKDFWCDAQHNPVLGVNDGYYKGYEAIEGYYDAQNKLTALRTRLARAEYPEAFASLNDTTANGAGAMKVDNLSTPIIEVARDGKTAKGMWYVVTTDFELTAHGPEARWMWGRIGIDFIRTENGFRIWHIVYAEDINAPMGTDWTKPEKDQPEKENLRELAAFEIPAPNVKAKVHERFYRERPVNPFPMVPQPYSTFAETYSYTI